MKANSVQGAVDANGRYFVGTMNDPALVGQGFTDEGKSPLDEANCNETDFQKVSSSASTPT